MICDRYKFRVSSVFLGGHGVAIETDWYISVIISRLMKNGGV